MNMGTKPRRTGATVMGFTLIELLVAMSIGLIIMNVAFTALHFTRKFVRKGETIGAKNDVMQSMMLWCQTQPSPASTYPAGPQTRLMGGRITQHPQGIDFFDAQRRIIYKLEALQFYNTEEEAPKDISRPLPLIGGKCYSVAGTLYACEP